MAGELAIIEKQLLQMQPLFEQVLRPTRTGLTAQRMIRTIVISCERNTDLLDCTTISIMQAAMTGAVLGLEADGVTGQGFLVPFRIKGVPTAQWITGYKGQATLGWRAGLTIDGKEVREGDEFDFRLGSNPWVDHKPRLGLESERRIVSAWGTATAPARTPIVVVMSIDEILEIKAKSPGARRAESPWNIPGIPFAAMCAKTARRRLSRSTPLSPFVLASRIDEAHEEQGKHAFLHHEQGIVIDGVPEKGLVIDGVAQPLAEAQPPALGITEVAKPAAFLIQGREQTLRLPTIEQWRARMIDNIEHMIPAAVEKFYDLNAVYLDEYHRDHPREVEAVIAAFDKKRNP
jgi:recombination protein RecT